MDTIFGVSTDELESLIDCDLGRVVEMAMELRADEREGFTWLIHKLWDEHRPSGQLKPARRPVRPALRRRVMERDEYACVDCGSPDDLQLDHVVPVVKGGLTDEGNLQVLCAGCNRSKKDR